MSLPQIHATTIIAVKREGKTAIAGDGQVTIGQAIVVKNNAKKVRRIYNDQVVIGFAGSAADAFNLSQKFEEQLEKYSGNLMRASVEVAGLWRSDKYFKQLEAMMIVADKNHLLIISGIGDVIEPESGVYAIGSGGGYAYAAARALMHKTKLSAKEIAVEAMKVAGEICVYTNTNITVEEV